MNPALVLTVAAQQLNRDPLSRFQCACDAQRRALEFFFQGLDTHARGPNGGGKTTIGAAGVLALAQGRESLGGLQVPHVPQPSVWWVITKTRRQQVDAAQATYLKLLGDWPHDIGWASKSLNYIEVLRVKPLGWHSDDPATWSRIVFHCEAEGQSVPGGRVNGAHADEAPRKDIWDEVRARAISNQPLYLIITETPLDRDDWWWLKEHEAGYSGCFNRPWHGRVEVKWGLREVQCHAPSYIERMIQSYAGSAYFEARVNGEYVDVSGSCPFDAKGLERWFERTHEPQREDVYALLGGADPDDEHVTHAVLNVYEDLTAGESYQLVADPSSGIQDGPHDETHNPYGLQVHALMEPRLVAESMGYLDPWSLGLFAVQVGRRYADAKAHVETNRYGDTVIAAMRRSRYTRIARQVSASTPGQMREQYGFATTDVNRWQGVAAVQKAVLEDSFRCPSASVVRQLMDTRRVRTPSGAEKWESKGRDHHGEHVICLGWGLREMGLMGRPASAREQMPGFDDTPLAILKELGLRPAVDKRPQVTGGMRWR